MAGNLFEQIANSISYDADLPAALKNRDFKVYYDIGEALNDLKENGNNRVIASAKLLNGDGNVFFVINEERNITKYPNTEA